MLRDALVQLARLGREAARLRVWFKVLVGLYREATSFSRADALSIARKTRADGHDVDRVVRELEEDGSIEWLGPEVFAFVPYNRARSNAA